jgi:hypothetical protein
MKHFTCKMLLRAMLTAPNGAIQRSRVNPSVVAKLVRDGHASATGANVMITRAGRVEAERAEPKEET